MQKKLGIARTDTATLLIGPPNDPQPFEVSGRVIELTKQGEVVAVDRLAREALAFLLLNVPLRNEAWVQDEAGLLVAKLRASAKAVK